jgi:hypothetical protein
LHHESRMASTMPYAVELDGGRFAGLAEADRTRANTWHTVNAALDRAALLRIDASARAGAVDVPERLAELDREWDFDRVLEAEAAVMGLTALALGVFLDRRLLAAAGVVSSMVALHGTQGWYPLLPLFRRLGVRTREEIDRERYALKALRGDFSGVGAAVDDAAARATAAWKAVCA